jgi:hypothetical protein
MRNIIDTFVRLFVLPAKLPHIEGFLRISEQKQHYNMVNFHTDKLPFSNMENLGDPCSC